LLVWQESYKLAIAIYRATRALPKEEQYALTSQLRRAAVSVSSNIAEGFGRRTSTEKDQFYAMAYGSLTEIETQLLIARGVGYLNKTVFEQLENLCLSTQKGLAGLQRVNKQKGAEAIILESRI
jgi:four helix bundle protein